MSPVTSGFFDSVSNDRAYNAAQMSRMFEGIILDGVFPTVGTALAVTQATGMNVNVGIGRAWFYNTWTYNDSILVLTATNAEVTLNRIDSVVLEVNIDPAIRANTIKIIKGTPATTPVAPSLITNATVHQYALAFLTISANQTTIPTAKITNNIGSVATPYVAGILDPLAITASSTTTLTNKRITARVFSAATYSTVPNATSYDMHILTAQNAAFTVAAPTGTPTEGQNYIFRFKDNGTARAITWNAIYRPIGTALPLTTVANKTMYVAFKYNATDSKWDLLANPLEV